MTVRVGVHFIRRRILRRAEAHGGHVAHSSVFRCAAGFEAVVAASAGGDVRFESWDEHEPAEDFAARSDVLLGIPDIRLLTARERLDRPPPYLALVMGDATRAIPFAAPVMARLRPDDTLICTCSADCEVLRLFLDAPTASSIAIAPMPSELSRFAPPDGGRADPLAGLGLDPRRPVLLSAERFKPAKGVHRIVPFAAHLRDRGHDPVLVFVGAATGPAKTPYQAELESLLAGARLTGSAVMLPFQDARGLAALYGRSTLAVSASTIYDNNYGYVPIESMVAGTPPVVTDWGGYRDAVLDGVTGAHMPTTLRHDGEVDVDWLTGAEAAAALLDDQDRYHRFAAAGRRHAEDTYSVRAALRTYSALARTALERDPGALPPWRVNDLGRTAIRAGWTDQTDNADRTGRTPRASGPRSPDHDTIHRLVYGKYATRSTTTTGGS